MPLLDQRFFLVGSLRLETQKIKCILEQQTLEVAGLFEGQVGEDWQRQQRLKDKLNIVLGFVQIGLLGVDDELVQICKDDLRA